MVSGSDDSMDDLFDRLVRKQANNEVTAVGKEPLSDVKRDYLYLLFKLLGEHGPKFDPEHLAAWNRTWTGECIPGSLVIFAAFVKGIPLPLIEDSEINSEPLGELGTCLMVGPKLFGFHDAVTGIVHLPDNPGILADCPRFSTFFTTLHTLAHGWSGCHAGHANEPEKAGGTPVVVTEFDGLWAGEQAKSVMEQFMRLTFADKMVVYGAKKMEDMTFERDMRKAFGQ